MKRNRRERAQFAPLPRIRSSAASVDAKPTGTECDDLQETTGHCDILEKVDELALVSQIVVEGECRRHREDRQNRRIGSPGWNAGPTVTRRRGASLGRLGHADCRRQDSTDFQEATEGAGHEADDALSISDL